MVNGWNRLSGYGYKLPTGGNSSTSVCIGLAGTLALVAVITGNPVLAQIVPDNTLGTENSVVVPNLTIRGIPGDRIDGGALRGANLFHSFFQFNVNEGRGAYFSNPVGVENILSRVTGGDPSRIMGRLGVLGNANLFLLNPNGILFGPNASLDVQGSFVASTASAIQLGDNGQFSATDPASSTLLAVQPGALFLNALTGQTAPTPTGTPTAGEIVNQANLASGQDLTLSANNLTLQGQLQAGQDLTLQATNTLQIRDSATTPFIAQSGRDLVVQGNQSVDIFALNHPNSGLFSGRDMVLRSPNPVIGDAHYWSGGNFRVERLDGSPGSLTSPNDPVIRTSGDVVLNDYTGTSLHIFAGGSVTILGDIRITGPDTANGLAGNVTLSDGTTVFINGAAEPVLDIRAGTTDYLPEGLLPIPFPGPGNTISGGSISPPTAANITIGRIFNLSGFATGAGQILLTNQHSPDPSRTGSIQAGQILAYGDVNIDSRQNIRTTGLIDTTIANQDGGDIRMRAGGTITAEGNLISSVTAGQGVAGDIILQAAGDVRTRDVIAASNNSTLGGFATVRIESFNDSVFLDGVRVVTSNSGTQFAGDIFIDAFDNVEITNSSVESIGNFGRIFVGKRSPFGDNIYPDNVIIRKSSLTATNSGTGTGGLVDVAAWINIDIDNATVQTTSSGQANGGSVNLLANFGNITLTGSALVDASISGTGNGGNGVTIAANNGTVSLTSNSQINTATTGTTAFTSAGPISITANRVAMSDNSALNATTAGAAPGGNITLNTNNGSIELDTSSLINTAVQPGGTAQGGDITIDTGSFALNRGARVQTRTLGSGDAGNIQLNFTNTAAIAGLDNASLLYSGMSSDTASTGAGGNITINSPTSQVGNLTLSGGAFLSARTTDTASNAGNGGDIAINVNNLSVLDGGQVLTSSSNDGDAGNITVNATGAVNIAGSRNPLPSPNSPFATLPTLISLNGVALSSVVNPNVEQSGAGGIPFVSIQRDGAGTITANAAPLGSSNSVDYYQFTITRDGSRAIFDIDNAASNPVSTVDTELFLYDALTGQLLASNDDFNPANNGSTSGLDSRIAYNFNSPGTYVLGVGRFNTTAANSTLVTGTPLAPTDPYQLQVSLQNQGFGTFNVGDRNPNQGLNSGLFAQAQSTGFGGDITVQSSSFTLTNNAELSATTAGFADGGNIAVTATNSGNLPPTTPILVVDGGSISAAVVSPTKANPFATGNGGSVTLTANNGAIAFNNLASVNASTDNNGNGGTVLVQTTGGAPISMGNGSRIEARTQGAGAAGAIQVNAPNIAIDGFGTVGGEPLYSGLYVSSESDNSAQGGSITINTPTTPGQTLVVSNGAVLSALNQSSAAGGSITVNVADVRLLNGGQMVTAAEGSGPAGNITINATNVTIAGTNPNFIERRNVATGNGIVAGIGGNDAIAGAQALGNFTLTPNGNITLAAVIPHVSIAGTGDGTYDYYAFNVTAGNRAIFDIDGDQNNDNSLDPGNFDTELFLFNAATGELLAQNDDANPTLGAGGSSPTLLTGGRWDSFIDYTFTNPGTYVIGVGRFNSEGTTGGITGTTPQPGDAYTLHVSLDQRNTRNANQGASSGLFAQSTGVDGDAGTLTINASQVTLQNNARISAATTSGDSGSILFPNLTTLQVQDSLISVSTETGTAGNVIVNAAQSVRLSGTLADGTPAGLLAAATAGGDAGGIQMTTPLLNVLDGAQATVSSTGAGLAGNLEVRATAVTLDNNGLLAANTQQGSGGNIQLRNLQTLQVLDNSQISASTVDGQGGFLQVNAARSVALRDGGGLFAQATGNGNAGDLAIATGTFTATNGAQATVSSRGTGSAGNLTLSGGSVRLENSGRLTADTVFGRGGNIDIRNVDLLQLNNLGEISTSTVDGQAGTLTVQTNSLISDRGRISSRSSGSGNAGLIRLNVDTYAATNNGEIRASSERGGGGRIEINAEEIFLTGSSPIISSVFDGRGGGGSIIINADLFIALEDSDILANAVDGRGGEIRIDAPVFVADIFANVGRNPGRDLSRFRNNGRVDISASSQVDTGSVNVPDFSFLQNSLSSLATNFVDPDQVVAGSCIARRNVEQGSFTVTGAGGVPRTPYDAITGNYPSVGVRSLNGQTRGATGNASVVAEGNPAKIPDWQPGDRVEEAQGMMTLPGGRLVLGTMSQLADIAKADDLICHPVTAPSDAAKDRMETRAAIKQGLRQTRAQEQQGI